MTRVHPSTFDGWLLVRTSLVVILIAAALGLNVWFGSLEPAPAANDPPGGGDVAHDYDAYLGQRVEIYGQITATNPVVITGEYDDRRLSLKVTDVSTTVKRGEYLHVYGVVRPGGTIEAVDVVVYPADGIWYTYLVSCLAVVWLLYRALNHWEVDSKRWVLRSRQKPLTRWGQQ